MGPENKNKEQHLPSHWKKTQLHCLPKLCTENKIWPMDNSSTSGEHLCTADRGHFPPLNRCYFTWENCSKRHWSIRRMKKRYSPFFQTSIFKRQTEKVIWSASSSMLCPSHSPHRVSLYHPNPAPTQSSTRCFQKGHNTPFALLQHLPLCFPMQRTVVVTKYKHCICPL